MAENKHLSKVTIVTHSSKFHTDDIFAVATLCLLLETDHDIEIIRTREKEIIDKADYVVDVGDSYDPDHNRFDHHQSGGAGVRDNTVPYASFGLVWKQYGEKLSGNKEVAEKIDSELVQLIDAYDNAFEIFDSRITGLYSRSLFSVLSGFNPTWKEDDNFDEVFVGLLPVIKTILKRYIKDLNDNIEAREYVRKAYEEAADKRLIVLSDYYPSEETLSQFPEPLFVIYPKSKDGTWDLKTIRNDPTKYDRRKDLPESWAGKRDEELEKITGVPGSVFCHRGRFLAVAKTKEAALKLAEIALSSKN